MPSPQRYDTKSGPRWRVRVRHGGRHLSFQFDAPAEAQRFCGLLGNADTDAMYQSFVVSPAQVIEFRVVETSGVNAADVTAFVEFGWAF